MSHSFSTIRIGSLLAVVLVVCPSSTGANPTRNSACSTAVRTRNCDDFRRILLHATGDIRDRLQSLQADSRIRRKMNPEKLQSVCRDSEETWLCVVAYFEQCMEPASGDLSGLSPDEKLAKLRDKWHLAGESCVQARNGLSSLP